MAQKIVNHVKPDKHTEYMACAQYVDWIVQAFDNNDLGNGYIVQEINLEKIIDDTKTVLHYFEAWLVINGECNKDSFQDCDDLFCIGHPYDDGDALQESIGHKGKVSFIPRVFWVRKGQPLYNGIQLWPKNVVIEANGLPACYYTEDLAKQIYECPEFFREPFYHEWRLDEPKRIYTVVLRYFLNKYHRDNKTDLINFSYEIDDFFPMGTYPNIKKKIIDSWKTQ